MTGPKLNERSFVAGERSGTKATAKYVRGSASKARAVLDLIRGLDVVSADEILAFTDRHAAHDVRKVLASAVANAVANDFQEAEELYVVACFADEGPTLRRFRPRARGRATRINKRTCHITVIVARMGDDRLSVVQARRDRQGGGAAGGRPRSASSRRERVQRSRERSAAEQPTVDETTGDEATDAETTDDATPEAAEATDVDEATATGDGIVAGEWPGSAQPTDDGEPPAGHEIKGNAGSMLYHEPGSRYYGATKAEVWFDTVESAEAAGFSKPGESAAEPAADDAADEAEES